jgi:glucose uptake protein
VIFSTFVFNLFFMNLPVQGKPVDIAEYFRGALQKHALGVFGGIVWYAGLIAILVRARFDATARVSTQASYAIEQSAMLIAALCGLLVWKEYDGSDSSVRLRLGLMFVLLAVGIGAMTAGVAVVR